MSAAGEEGHRVQDRDHDEEKAVAGDKGQVLENPAGDSPSRLAAKAVVAEPTSLKRWANTRLARKTGAKAIAVAARNRVDETSERPWAGGRPR